MRIPFIHRKPEDIASIARRATRVGSAEVNVPPLSRTTLEEMRRAQARVNARRRNGSLPS
jgi:hypothetical protein